MEEEQKPQTGIEGRLETFYRDSDIAIFAFNEGVASCSPEGIRLKHFLFIPTFKGCLRLQVNMVERVVYPKQFLLCRPNDLLTDFFFSPDYQGGAIALSDEAVRDNVCLDSLVWDKSFFFNENPIVSISEEEIQLFEIYGKLVGFRSSMKERPNTKAVMTALIRACILDLMVGITATSNGDAHLYRREQLFRDFMKKLSSMEVKPRAVTWYADQLFVTPKYLSSVCRTVSGRTAFELINEAVLTDIRYQLKYSPKTIKEIADYLDFPNISFFGKYVRNHVGCSPKEYRRRLQSEQ